MIGWGPVRPRSSRSGPSGQGPLRILVTGGAGFIGSHIVDALVQQDHRLAVVDDLSLGRRENVHPTASLHRVDIRDAAALEAVFATERPEVVSHHAAQANLRRSMEDATFTAQVNVLGTLHLLELCVRHGVRQVVFASTCAVYADLESPPADEAHVARPLSAYGLSKLVGEQYLAFYREVYGLRFTAFRYGNGYGPRQDPKGEAGVVAIFAEQMRKGIRPTLFGDGTKTRDYVYVDDIVDANLQVLDGKADGEVLNLGRGRQIRDIDVFTAVRDALGVAVVPQFAAKRPGEMLRVALNSARAKAILGWEPRVSFEEGVPLAVAPCRTR